MPAVIEFGFAAPEVFTGVDRLEKRMQGFDRNVTKAGGGMMRSLGGVSMQVQDIVVQLQSGTKASVVLAQQGTQILSAFGPGGAIAGGALALGTAFYAMQEKGLEALAALKKESAGFDQDLRHLKAGGLSEMIDGLESMKKKAEEMKKSAAEDSKGGLYGSVMRFLAPSRFDDKSGKWVNSRDERAAMAEELAKKNTEGRAELLKQMIQNGNEELKIIELKGAGRNAEAAALERQVALRKKLVQFDALSEEERAPLVALTQKQAAAEDAAAAASEAQKQRDAEQALADLKHKASLDEMTLAKRIAAVREDVKRAAEEEARLRSTQGVDALKILAAETKKVELQRELNGLQKQFANEKEREFEAAKRTAEQEARSAEMEQRKNSDRRNSVMDTALEYKLLQAKARGNERAVEEVEREQRILERSRALQEQNGLSKEKATALAIKMADLEDRANGKGSRIRKAVDAVDDPEGRYGLSGRGGPLSESRPLSNGGPLSRNGGLDGYWDLQDGRIGQLGKNENSRREPQVLGDKQSFLDRSLKQAEEDAAQEARRKDSLRAGRVGDNELQTSEGLREFHKQNAAAAAGEERASSGDSALVDSFIEKLVAKMPPALADAILTKS